MALAEAPPTEPPRTSAAPDSYAIYVREATIHVWVYRVNAASPEGEWQFLESLDREDDPFLTLEYAKLAAPAVDGYWIYSRSYECKLACE